MGYIPPPPPQEVIEATTCFTTGGSRSFIVEAKDGQVAIDYIRQHFARPRDNYHFEATPLNGRYMRVNLHADTTAFMEGLGKARESVERFKQTVQNATPLHCNYCGRGRTSGNLTCDGCGAPIGARKGPGIPLPPPPNPRRVYE